MRRLYNNIDGKASTREDQSNMGRKAPTKLWSQQALDTKASTGEETKVTSTANHPLAGQTFTEKGMVGVKHPPQKPNNADKENYFSRTYHVYHREVLKAHTSAVRSKSGDRSRRMNGDTTSRSTSTMPSRRRLISTDATIIVKVARMKSLNVFKEVDDTSCTTILLAIAKS